MKSKVKEKTMLKVSVIEMIVKEGVLVREGTNWKLLDGDESTFIDELLARGEGKFSRITLEIWREDGNN